MTITLDAPGDDVRALIAEMDRLGPDHPRLRRNPLYDRMLRQYTKPRPVEPWVAEVLPGGRRRRLRGARDYTGASGGGRRGITMLFQLQPGRTYEINAPTSYSRARRYFARVEHGRITEVHDVHE